MRISALLLLVPAAFTLSACNLIDDTYSTSYRSGYTHVYSNDEGRGYKDEGSYHRSKTAVVYPNEPSRASHPQQRTSSRSQEVTSSSGGYRGYNPVTHNNEMKKPHAIVYRNKDGSKIIPKADGTYPEQAE